MSDALAEHYGVDARSFEGVDKLHAFVAGVEYARVMMIVDDPEAVHFEFDVMLCNVDRLLTMLRARGWISLSDIPANGWVRLHSWRADALPEDDDGV